MSNPRIKRPFAGAASDPSQRQITSFFNTRPVSTNDSSSEPLRQPALPASVQSNLLSVGMRIRKSVPEGYKTVGPSAFKLWTDNTTPATARSACAAASKYGAGRELLPFCGINKVGGMDTQPAWTRFDDSDDDGPSLDAVPELSLSQESVDSNAASDKTRKRFFEDEEPSDPARAWVDKDAWDGEVSPRSLTPWSSGNPGRVMAVPRTRAKKGTLLKQVDQENMAADQGNDFEDAEFLVYGNEMEMSG